MKSSEFAAAYRDQNPWNSRHSHPAKQTFLEKTNGISKTLGNSFMAYLEEGPTPALDPKLGLQFQSTGRFMRSHINELLPSDTDINESYDQQEDVDNALHYITVNSMMMPLWEELLTGRKISMKNLCESQVQLAAFAVDTMKKPLEDYKNGELYEWVYNHYKVKGDVNNGTFGAVAEIDTLVALLEACKTRRGLVALPSPAKFERATTDKSLNSDVLLIDTLNDTVHGVQVKLTNRRYLLSNGERLDRQADYNPDFVTVIDSEQDLKNFIFVRDQQSSKSLVAPMPGLYSAHFLLNQKNLFRTRQNGKNMTDRGFANFLMKAKYDARGMTNLAESSNKRVTTHLANLALSKVGV